MSNNNVLGTIAIQNNGKIATESQLKGWIDAAKIQCDRDLQPIWGYTVNFVYVPPGQKYPLADWYCSILDTADDSGGLAWHDVGPNNEPLIEVFMDLNPGNSGSVSFTHEVCEAIGDPMINTIMNTVINGSQYTIPQEICDPVESNTYQINGIDVTDFVYPAWFGGNNGPYDFLKICTNPGQILPGGYVRPMSGSIIWGDKPNRFLAKHENPHSRNSKYHKPILKRKKSTFEVDRSRDVRVKRF
jgi:hypothetical protein